MQIGDKAYGEDVFIGGAQALSVLKFVNSAISEK
jgi:hypothetical protein